MGPSETVSSQVEQITRPPSRGEWPLAGRTEELARLADILSASEPPSIVLAGPAGVGKTRLAEAALALAEQHGFATAVTTASQAAASVPLGAFAPLLPASQSRTDRRAAVLQAAVRSIAQRGNGQPVVLVVDDAHLLDDLSATVVHQLAAGDEACVVATVRTGEPVPDAVVNLWKDQAGERIDLTPLDQADTEALLTEVLDGPVDGAALHDLWHASQGNVLYLRELVLGAQEAGFLRRYEGIWRLTAKLTVRPRLVELIEARLADLAADEREVLELTALAEDISVPMLTTLAHPSAIDAVERKGLLTIDQDGRRHRVRLAHPLHGEVLRAQMPAIQRLSVQRVLADAVEAAQARRREDVLQAAVWRLESGGPARPNLLVAGALRALSARDQQLAERLAGAAVDAGAGPKARILLARALQSQRRADDALAALRPLAEAHLTEEALTESVLIRAEALAFLGREADAEDVLRQAEQRVHDPDLRSDLAAFRVAQHLSRNRPLRAIVVAEHVLSRAPRPGRGHAGAIAAGVPAWAITGRADDAVTHSDAVAEVAMPWEEELPWAFGLFESGRAVALRFAGRLHQCATVAEAGYRSAIARRDRDAQAAMATVRGQAELAIGRVASAAWWFREGVTLLRDADPAGHLPQCLGGLIQAQALGGHPADISHLTAEAGQCRSRRLGLEMDLGRVWHAAVCGNLHQARTLALDAAADARATGQFSYEAVLLHDVTRLGKPESVVDRLSELAATIQGALVPVYAAHAAGLTRRDGAALEAVSASFEQHGALLLAAESAAEASAAHREAGERRRATRSCRRALDLAADCEEARTPALARAWQPAELTEREREIVMLAATGSTSKAIAAQLVVSVRTIQNHLQRAYEKLGVTSRDELAQFLDAPTAKQSESMMKAPL